MFETIFVHTPHRTGGGSITKFLNDLNLPIKVHHVLYLQHGSRFRRQSDDMLKEIAEMDPKKVGIITSSREPVGHNISMFWHVFVPILRGEGNHMRTDIEFNKENVSDWFDCYQTHWDLHEWYGRELRKTWGLDPLYDIDHYVPPYMKIEDRMLITRIDDLSHLPEAISDWLGVETSGREVPVVGPNRHPDRWEWPVRLSDAYLASMYHPVRAVVPYRYPDWFYDEGELASFESYWKSGEAWVK